MADQSNTDDASPTTGAKLKVENNNNTSHVTKRNYATMMASSSEESEDDKPDEKRPAFQLHPPTLIQWQTKPILKSDEDRKDTSKCKFLQAPKLSAPSSSSASLSAVNQISNSKRFVPKSNPFLKITDNGSNEEQENEENSVCEDNQPKTEALSLSNGKSPLKVNESGLSKNMQQHDVTGGEANKKDVAGSKSENLFLQATSSNDKSATSFVFGSKMEDRVAINSDAKSSSKDSGDGKSGTSGFVFGQNISDRAEVSSSTVSTPSLFLSPSGSSTADSSFSSNPGESSNDRAPNPSSPISEKKLLQGLKEDAAAHFLASQTKHVMPEVDVTTGEEDEKNVLQMLCKLHQFDASTQNWVERAVGNLRLNDGESSSDDLHFQSRLVIRAHGSFRLVLNTKIWAQMAVKRANKKSIRITAQTEEGGIGVFLITCTINDAEQIFRSLEYRVLHQKQIEEKTNAIEKVNKCERSQDAVTNSGGVSDANSDPSIKDKEFHPEEVTNCEKSPLVDANEQHQPCDADTCSSSADDERKVICTHSTSDTATCAPSYNAEIQPLDSSP